MRIIDVIERGIEFLSAKSIESPRLNVELMLCETLKLSRLELYLAFEKPLTEREIDALRDMLKRRAKRVPLQYILGRTHFYGVDLKLTPAALIPRPETEELAELAAKSIQEMGGSVMALDIGAGTGCIALSLAKKFPESSFEAVDLSPQAVELALENARSLGLGNYTATVADALSADFVDSSRRNKYDIIISNPPYIPVKDFEETEPEVKKYEPRQALTDEGDGLKFYRRFAVIFPELLKENGRFFVENGLGQSGQIIDLFINAGMEAVAKLDFARKDRFVVGSYPGH
ncbi:MAG: peptide chain release factor N(5)-glutamine methyltransferase [Chloroflexota bacterium]